MSEHESTIISLPENSDWIEMLKEKKQDYDDRIVSRGLQYRAPEQKNTQVEYALHILKTLLDDGTVDSFQISRLLLENQEENFNVDNFNKAFGVIVEYATDMAYLVSRLQ